MSSQNIEINNKSAAYRKFNVEKIIYKYLSKVNPSDLIGIKKINIYEDCPSNIPNDKAGGYLASTDNKMNAELDIYLNQTLHNMMNLDDKNGYMSVLMDKLFLNLVGRLFLADTLFHEIGHHKFYSEYPDSDDSNKNEAYSIKYANECLWRCFPLIYRNYNLFNHFYKCVYKSRIISAEKRNERQEIKKGRHKKGDRLLF